MLRRLFTRSILSVVIMHVNATVLDTVELKLRLVLRMERGKTVVTRRAMEKHHVAQDTLSSQHLAQKFLTERRMNLSSSNRDVVIPAGNYCSRELCEVASKRLFLAHGPLKRTRRTLVANMCRLPLQRSVEIHSHFLDLLSETSFFFSQLHNTEAF